MKAKTLAFSLTTLFSFGQAQANILFCDFDNIGRVGIREVENTDTEKIMRVSWIYDEGLPFTDLALDKIHSYYVTDNNIDIGYSAYAVEGGKAFQIDINVKPGVRFRQVCHGPWGVPVPCYTVSESIYEGFIKVQSSENNYDHMGNAICKWQYRKI